MKPSIIIADDHPLLLRGLWDFLDEKKYNLLGMAKDGGEALTLIQKYNPEIAILDIQMPVLSGIEVAQKCKQLALKTRIVLITLHKGKEIFQEAEKLHIYGYLLKEFALKEIVTCLDKVQQGQRYFSPQISELLEEGNPIQKLIQTLTPSEKKILKLISQGDTNQKIAEALFLSPRTIEKHRSNIIQKLNIDHKTNSLLIWAQQHKSQWL